MAHRIIPRSEWGARYANGFGSRALGALETRLHHSVTVAPDLVPPWTDDYAAVRQLESIGQSRFGRGISYNTVFTPAGLIFEGLGIDRVGAHTGGRNTITAGLVLVGNYEKDRPTRAQLEALSWYLQHGVEKRWWKRPILTGGHRDVAQTACPGRHAYDLIDDINRGTYRATTPIPGGFMADLTDREQKQAFDGINKILDIVDSRVIDGPAGEPKEQQPLTTTAALRRLMIEQRAGFAKAEKRDAAQTAIIRTLAESKGIDGAAVLRLLETKLDEALADVEITLSTKES